MQGNATIWQGCYDDSWKGEIVDEAFAHPAKMARGLVRRIFDHLDLPRGSVVVDLFGGVGTTGIEAASRGLRFFGVELEEKFVTLARQNFALHRRTWEGFGDPQPVILQGDSRELRKVIKGYIRGVDCVVGSPPFQGAHSGTVDKTSMVPPNDGGAFAAAIENDAYGKTPGQLGNMPAGNVDAVVGSPPWEAGADGVIKKRKFKDPAAFAAKMSHADVLQANRHGNTPKSRLAQMERDEQKIYGDTEGNIGNQTGQTFWTAARDIVRECHAILKPGVLAVWVCKDFIRKGARVPFSDDWRRLCESEGFDLVEWIHASLVKTESHPDLFGGDDIVKTTERKSFFRRLAEKKGSPAIDHEDVLILRKAQQ